MILGIDPKLPVTWQDGMIYGARLGATYMGYVVLLAGGRAGRCASWSRSAGAGSSRSPG